MADVTIGPGPRADRRQRRLSRAWIAPSLGIATAAVLAAVPLLDFLAANLQMLFALRRLLTYYVEIVLVVAVFGVLAYIVFRRWTSIPLHSWLIASGAATLLVFNYHEVRAIVGAASGPSPAALALLAALVAGAVTLVLRAARTRVAVAVAFAIVLGLTVQPALVIVPAAAARQRALMSEQQRFVGVARVRPNIYWIVLDGYPRRDVLREQFGFDDTLFHDGLRERGFVVQDAAVANYPLSITSIAATLSGRYLYSPETAAAELHDLNPLYPIVRGRNLVVQRLHDIGYRYVHFANGYDYMTLCGDFADRCVVGSEQLDEVDVALLSRTPYFDFAPPKTSAAEDEPFIRGAIADLTDKLPYIREVDGPRFVYAHLIVPHPPLRFDRRCVLGAAAPDLLGWDAARRPEFVEQVQCAGSQTLELIDAIHGSDPDAVLLVQSDHGPAFNHQFQTPVREWSAAQVKERFAVLSAVRLPAMCADVEIPASTSLVNTFPLVFACLTGTRPSFVADRSFIIVSHDGDARMGGIEEIATQAAAPLSP